MLSKAITLLCAATSVLAFQPGTVRAVPTLSLQRNAGLNLQSRSGGVARAAALRKQPAMLPQSRVVMRGDDNKIDLDSVDWSKADKADAWAQYKNAIYFGSAGIALLLPIFFQKCSQLLVLVLALPLIQLLH